MWMRSAFFIGAIRAGYEQRFTKEMNETIVPAMRQLPGVRAVSALWPRRLEDNPPEIACQVIVQFDRREDIELMLQSPGRQSVRERVKELLQMFEGRFSHIDYEVGSP